MFDFVFICSVGIDGRYNWIVKKFLDICLCSNDKEVNKAVVKLYFEWAQ